MCGADWDAVVYVPDRRSNDIRYSMAWTKIADSLGYTPTHDLEEGLAETVDWYRRNPDRWAPLTRAHAPLAQAAAPTGEAPGVA
jgi:dTDP-glucose 4,6-dehydratase